MRNSDRAHWLRLATELLQNRLGPSECEMLHYGLVELSQRPQPVSRLSASPSIAEAALAVLLEEEMASDWEDENGHWIRAQMPD